MNQRQRGSASIEFIMLTLLLIVPLMYIVIAVFETQRAAYGVTAASVAGARAFIDAPEAKTASKHLDQAVRITLSDYDVRGAQVSSRCVPECFVPGSTVEVRVEAHHRLPLAPDVLGRKIASIQVSSLHAEPFGKYRAGTP